MEPLPESCEESIYIHLTLYQFNPEARQQVIQRVNAELDNTSARCWYDVEENSFELRCPCTIGAVADQALAAAIKHYFEQESKATELEDREPNVLRFPESDIQPLNGYIDDLEEEMIQREAASNTQDETTDRPSFLAFHLIETEGPASMPLKLFGLYELPEGLLERALCSAADKEMTKAIRCGVTARAVRSEGKHDNFVFNGRLGSPIGSNQTLELESSVPFPILEGHSALDVPIERNDTLMSETSDGPVMDKWFAGMAQTEPEEPEQDPEVPKDARKLFAPGHQPLSGKTRIPKADPDLRNDTEGSDSDDEAVTQSATSKDFAYVMAKTKARTSKSEDRDTTTEFSEEDEDAKESMLFSQTQQDSMKGVTHPRQSFAALLGREEVPGPSSSLKSAESGNAQAQFDLASSLGGLESSSRTQIKRSGTNGDGEMASYNELQSYGPQFAAVDSIGLTANAANQATWNIQHYERGKKAKRSKFRSAEVQTPLAARPTSGSAPISLSTGRNLPHPQASQIGRASGHTSNLASETTPANNPYAVPWTNQWSHNVVRQNAPQETLIDDTASYGRDPVKMPPGLQPFSTTLTDAHSQTTSEVGLGPSMTHVDETSAGHMVDVENVIPLVGLSLGTQQQASSEPHVRYNDDSNEGDGTIVERLRPQQEDTRHFQKKHTMGQKAKKKGKAVKHKVELPLPDPVPLPKPSLQSAKQNSSSTPKIDVRANAEVYARAKTAEDIGTSLTNAERLDSFLQKDHLLIQSSELRVRLGLILNLNGTKAMRDRVITAAALADDLNNNCSTGRVVFNGRLTTEVNDVSHLLDSLDSPLSAEVLYEFHARDSSGKVHRIEVEVSQDGSLEAQSLREVTTEIYMHFPIRVWDAMVSLQEVPTNTDFLDAFLASLSTLNEPPSFTALVPSNQFSIEKVFAKRKFTRPLSEDSNGRLVLTEVQDLFVSSLNAPNANLQATCLSPEEMTARQRLWWEAHFEGLSDGAEICDAVNGVITLMDGVGFNSRGPWTAAPQEQDEEVDKEPSFW
ncbi:hypothetical protein KC343_g3935 [Hortaea werneckii]|nr:hypothetical protein KC352_g11636 [Hortaea werneckii]KAI7568151.1 hypothetical protein KC317_g4452 [Hortaea werneckii]KAI7620865.1 hypothetical protein KC346_g3902 [Hortaea werneckii]KAI7631585.1 hypothetical protein KC343_g3935 [Hortaea werneckii]KAI7676870.1 hypothetical protein KC319_g4245 [Hortaea werneckii]